MMNAELTTVEKLFTQLTACNEEVFPPLHGKLNAPTKQGVYVIIDPKGDVAHVGSTPRAKNGIAQRLRNHLSGLSSFTYCYLNDDSAKLRNNYKFKYVVVKQPRIRVLLEAYAISHLCPKHLGVG